ncbi:hypothetical protein H2203_003290 [Taxawa tesnikishii (nom. ined.)]|nr:hypothetical protein H2203_003290 [Dothideales sp. JES 119]
MGKHEDYQPLVNVPRGSVSVSADDDIVIAAIPTKIIESLEPKQEDSSPKKRNVFRRMSDAYKKMQDFEAGRHTQFVRMPRVEYEQFWARDAKGKYCGTEPEGSEEGLELLRQRLKDEEMQGKGKKDVEKEIVETWKPLEERTGWTHTAVGYRYSGMN